MYSKSPLFKYLLEKVIDGNSNTIFGLDQLREVDLKNTSTHQLPFPTEQILDKMIKFEELNLLRKGTSVGLVNQIINLDGKNLSEISMKELVQRLIAVFPHLHHEFTSLFKKYRY